MKKPTQQPTAAGQRDPTSLRILRREFLATAATLGTTVCLDGCAHHADVRSDNGLSTQERAALHLAVRVMLPDPLPATGPSVGEVVDNLQRFLQNADSAMFAALRKQLGELGAIAGLFEHHVADLKRFVSHELQRGGASPHRDTLDSLHRVAVLGYYAHTKAYRALDYEPILVEPLHHISLPVRTRPSANVTFDVAIVGSGVAGALLANRLSAQGKRVVILESGPYVPEASLDTDELKWLARLDRGSGLQQANTAKPYLSSTRSFPVLQGHCVGGGSVINNAICFQMPSQRFAQWHAAGFPLDEATLRTAYASVATEHGIGPVSQALAPGATLNPSLSLLSHEFGTAKVPDVARPPTPGFYECLVNMQASTCRGCGLCNTGCRGERKRNALQVHLPLALAREGTELVANARVEQIMLDGGVGAAAVRVAGLGVRSATETFVVRAREYVISAGAIHTPALLLGSPDVRARVPHVGERCSMNIVSPVLGFMNRVVHPHPSLQLTHYWIPEDPQAGFMIENLYNPPGQAALVMSGYGDVHFERMRRYKSTLLAGAVLPTEANGSIRIDKDRRPIITQPLAEQELARMRKALSIVAGAMLRAGTNEGAYEVVVGNEAGGFALHDERDLPRFESWLRAFHQIALSTGHPQGGCAMSEDPALAVVGADYRAAGIANLRICDASLFPVAAGVNPQWTVMALADHCASVMNAES